MMFPRFRHLPRHPQAAPATPRPAGGATLTVHLGPVVGGGGGGIARVPRFNVAAAATPVAPAAPAAVAAPASPVATGSQETLRVILSGLVEELAAEVPVPKEGVTPAAVHPLAVLPAAVADPSSARLPWRRPPFRRAGDRVHHGAIGATRQSLLPAA